jgi:iron complex outermembrane receptor protein
MEAPLGSRVAAAVRGGGRKVEDVRVGGGATLANSYFNNLYGEGALGYVGDAFSGGFSFGSYHFDYGLPASPESDEGGVHLEGARQELKGRSELSLGERGITALKVDGTAQWYQHDEIEHTGEVGTAFKLNTQTLNATARTAFGALSGAFGASGLLQQYAAEGEEALTPPARTSSAGVFLFQEVPLGIFGTAHAPRLQVGARYDALRIRTEEGDEKFGAPSARDFNSISGSVGVSVPVSDGVSLGVSAARAFRAPSVEELYSNAFHAAVGSFDRGNRDLKEEVNQGVEAVLRAQSHAVHAQVAAYASRVNDFIAPTLVGDTTIAGPEGTATVPLSVFTQADATMKGAEAKFEATVGPRLVLGAMGDVVRGRFTDGSALPFMPAARVGGSARWDDGKLSLGGELRHAFAQTDVPEHELATDAYTLFGLDAGYRRIAGSLVHSVSLKVDNLFDVRYRDASSRIKEFAPNPGRNVSLVYRVVF